MKKGHVVSTFFLIVLLSAHTYAVEFHKEDNRIDVLLTPVDYSDKILQPKYAVQIAHLVAQIDKLVKQGKADIALVQDLYLTLRAAWLTCSEVCRDHYMGYQIGDFFSFIDALPKRSDLKMTDATRRLLSSEFKVRIMKTEELQTVLEKRSKIISDADLKDSSQYKEIERRTNAASSAALAFDEASIDFLIKAEKEKEAVALLDSLTGGQYGPVNEASIRAALQHQEGEYEYLPLQEARATILKALTDKEVMKRYASSTDLNPQMEELVGVVARIIDVTQGTDGKSVITRREGPDAEAAFRELHEKWKPQILEIARRWSNSPLEIGIDNPWGVRVDDLGWAIISAAAEKKQDGSLSINIDEKPATGASPSDVENSFTLSNPRDFQRFVGARSNPTGDIFRSREKLALKSSDENTPTVSAGEPPSLVTNHADNSGRGRPLHRKESLPDVLTQKPERKQKEVSITSKENKLPQNKLNAENNKKKFTNRKKLTPEKILTPKNIAPSSVTKQTSKASAATKKTGGIPVASSFPDVSIGNASVASSIQQPLGGNLGKNKPSNPQPEYFGRKRAIFDGFAYSRAEKLKVSKTEKREVVSLPIKESFDPVDNTFKTVEAKQTIGKQTKMVYERTEEIVKRSKDKSKILQKSNKVTTFGPIETVNEKITDYDLVTGRKTHVLTLQTTFSDTGKILSVRKIEVWYSPAVDDMIVKIVTTTESREGKSPKRQIITKTFDPATGKPLRTVTDEIPLIAYAF